MPVGGAEVRGGVAADLAHSAVLVEYLLCDYLTGEAENRDVAENVTWAPTARLTRFISADSAFSPILEALEAPR